MCFFYKRSISFVHFHKMNEWKRGFPWKNWERSSSHTFGILSWEAFSIGSLSCTYPWSSSSKVVCSYHILPFNPFVFLIFIGFLVFLLVLIHSWMHSFHYDLHWFAIFLFLWISFVLHPFLSWSRSYTSHTIHIRSGCDSKNTCILAKNGCI